MATYQEIINMKEFDNIDKIPSSYEMKDEFKKIGKIFKNENDKWDWQFEPKYVQRVIALLKAKYYENQEKTKSAWKQACKNLNVDFVKKTDPLYDDIKSEFMKIVKSQ